MATREYTVNGVQINETENEREYAVNGVQINETLQAAGGGRIMASLAGEGGLAGMGGLAGKGGGLAG